MSALEIIIVGRQDVGVMQGSSRVGPATFPATIGRSRSQNPERPSCTVYQISAAEPKIRGPPLHLPAYPWSKSKKIKILFSNIPLFHALIKFRSVPQPLLPLTCSYFSTCAKDVRQIPEATLTNADTYQASVVKSHKFLAIKPYLSPKSTGANDQLSSFLVPPSNSFRTLLKTWANHHQEIVKFEIEMRT